MRSTFMLAFCVNRNKEKNGFVSIIGRVIINKIIAQFCCKQRIFKDLWDAKGYREKARTAMKWRQTVRLTTSRRRQRGLTSDFLTVRRLTPLKWYETYISKKWAPGRKLSEATVIVRRKRQQNCYWVSWQMLVLSLFRSV